MRTGELKLNETVQKAAVFLADGVFSCFGRRKLKDKRNYIIPLYFKQELMSGEGNNEEGSGNSNQGRYMKKYDEAGPRRGRKRKRAPMRLMRSNRKFEVDRVTRSHSKRGKSQVEQWAPRWWQNVKETVSTRMRKYLFIIHRWINECPLWNQTPGENIRE